MLYFEEGLSQESKREKKEGGLCFLSCFYTNANSLGNKHDELISRIDMNSPDVIGVTETWEKGDFLLKGYHPPIRKDRANDQMGGGVMLFVKDCLKIIDCPQLNNSLRMQFGA